MSGSDSYSMEEQSSRTVPVREHWQQQQQQQQRRHSQCSSFLPPPPHFPGLVFSAGELLPEHCLPASQLIANRQLLLLLLLLTEWKHTWMSIASPLCLSLYCSHCVFVNVLFESAIFACSFTAVLLRVEHISLLACLSVCLFVCVSVCQFAFAYLCLLATNWHFFHLLAVLFAVVLFFTTLTWCLLYF